jgi:hypothetical protein
VTNLSKLTRYKYALGKFTKAVETLATYPTEIKERLFPASLDFAIVRREDLPEELHEDFIWIKQELTKRTEVVDLNSEYRRGDIRNTLFGMRNATGSKIAVRIVYLERELRRICDEIDLNILASTLGKDKGRS